MELFGNWTTMMLKPGEHVDRTKTSYDLCVTASQDLKTADIRTLVTSKWKPSGDPRGSTSIIILQSATVVVCVVV